MAIIVIGGHSRSVGKTSVVAGLVAALSDFHWMAIKITQYGHGICSANGQACDCATGDHSWAVTQDKNRAGDSDTSRYLVAGATQAWWVRTEQGRLAEAMPRVRELLTASENVILESNSILKFLRPDLYLPVLDPCTADFKKSAQEFLDRADAIILHDAPGAPATWSNVSLKPVHGKRVFRIAPPPYVTPEIVEFVRNRVGSVNRLPVSQPPISC